MLRYNVAELLLNKFHNEFEINFGGPPVHVSSPQNKLCSLFLNTSTIRNVVKQCIIFSISNGIQETCNGTESELLSSSPEQYHNNALWYVLEALKTNCFIKQQSLRIFKKKTVTQP